jgi:hypothetical protein
MAEALPLDDRGYSTGDVRLVCCGGGLRRFRPRVGQRKLREVVDIVLKVTVNDEGEGVQEAPSRHV